MASDTSVNYYINSASGTSIAYDSTNEAMKITCGSNTARNYCDLRSSNSALNLSDLLGKTVRFKITLMGLGANKRLQLVTQSNSGNLASTSYLTVDGEYYVDATIPSNATLVIFKINPYSSEWSEGSTYSFKDFEVYPV